MLDLPIFFDASAIREWMAPEEFVRLARKHGTDRILFGSDSPWFDQDADIRWIDASDLSSDEKEKIFHKNAEALLGE
jgi:predicted TIM-barrel fold metal-dependent hydrolase